MLSATDLGAMDNFVGEVVYMRGPPQMPGCNASQVPFSAAVRNFMERSWWRAIYKLTDKASNPRTFAVFSELSAPLSISAEGPDQTIVTFVGDSLVDEGLSVTFCGRLQRQGMTIAAKSGQMLDAQAVRLGRVRAIWNGAWGRVFAPFLHVVHLAQTMPETPLAAAFDYAQIAGSHGAVASCVDG